MKIKNFWIVLKPDNESLLVDILFKTDIKGFILQVLGGLRAKEIHGIWTTKKEAKKQAIYLLNKIKK